MWSKNFEYTRATSVDEAVNLLSRNENAKLLAGGHNLIPALKLRIAGMRSINGNYGHKTGDRVLREVGETLGRRQRVTHQVLLGSLLLFALMIGAAVAVIWRGTQVALDPLKHLAEQAAKRSGANLQPLELSLAPVEVRALIEAINLMMARLSRAWVARKRPASSA